MLSEDSQTVKLVYEASHPDISLQLVGYAATFIADEHLKKRIAATEESGGGGPISFDVTETEAPHDGKPINQFYATTGSRVVRVSQGGSKGNYILEVGSDLAVYFSKDCLERKMVENVLHAENGKELILALTERLNSQPSPDHTS
tara:strand:+ start:734 stop:1168 length:435 start_codon:yes stop_codon:yes gene_type:complete